jgi:hypothetical protein
VTIRSRAICGALALAVLVPAAAAAQSRTPYSDLFGRAPQRTGKEFTAVQFRSTAGAQMGRTLESELTPPGAEIPEGLSAGGDAYLTAEHSSRRLQVDAHGRYSYQEYRQEPAFGAPAFDTGVRMEVRPRTRLAFQGGVNFARAPFYQLMWLQPDLTSPLPPVDQSAILMLQNDSAEASAGVISRYSSRSSLELSALVKETDFALSPQRDFSSVGGTIMWRRQMSRDLSVHGGYGREEMRQALTLGENRFTNERIDVGVDYGKALSFARRTSFGFGTHTSFVRENEDPRRFRLNGHVTLDHRFARTWALQMSARRGTDFLPGFRAPVDTDNAHVALAGYLATRLLLNLNADGGQGTTVTDPRQFISYAGNAKLTFAMTRHLGMFTQYVYNHYQMPADPLTLFLVPRGARQAVSIGVETWVSILGKEKVTSDPR